MLLAAAVAQRDARNVVGDVQQHGHADHDDDADGRLQKHGKTAQPRHAARAQPDHVFDGNGAVIAGAGVALGNDVSDGALPVGRVGADHPHDAVGDEYILCAVGDDIALLQPLPALLVKQAHKNERPRGKAALLFAVHRTRGDRHGRNAENIRRHVLIGAALDDQR